MPHMSKQAFWAFISNKMNDGRSTVLLMGIQAPTTTEAEIALQYLSSILIIILEEGRNTFPYFMARKVIILTNDSLTSLWMVVICKKNKQKMGAIITPVKFQSLQLCKNNSPARSCEWWNGGPQLELFQPWDAGWWLILGFWYIVLEGRQDSDFREGQRHHGHACLITLLLASVYSPMCVTSQTSRSATIQDKTALFQDITLSCMMQRWTVINY